jgi:hypothetical protein
MLLHLAGRFPRYAEMLLYLAGRNPQFLVAVLLKISHVF